MQAHQFLRLIATLDRIASAMEGSLKIAKKAQSRLDEVYKQAEKEGYLDTSVDDRSDSSDPVDGLQDPD